MSNNAQLDAQYTQLVAHDPEIRRLLNLQKQAMANADRGGFSRRIDAGAVKAQIDARLSALGIDPKEWALQVDQAGNIGIDHQNIFERHPLAFTTAAIAAPFAIASLPAFASASAPTAAAGGNISVPALSSSLSGTAAANGAATVAPAVAAGGTTAALTTADKIFSNPLVKYGLPVGATVVGKVLDYKAQSKAAQLAQEAADKALALQQEAAAEAKRIAERQYADKAPYRNVGSSAISTLGALMGLPTTASPATAAPAPTANLGGASGSGQSPPPVTTNPAPTGEGFTPDQAMINRGQMAPPPVSLGSLNAGASTTVNVRAPNQQVYAIPHERVQEALDQGGQVVQ